MTRGRSHSNADAQVDAFKACLSAAIVEIYTDFRDHKKYFSYEEKDLSLKQKKYKAQKDTITKAVGKLSEAGVEDLASGGISVAIKQGLYLTQTGLDYYFTLKDLKAQEAFLARQKAAAKFLELVAELKLEGGAVEREELFQERVADPIAEILTKRYEPLIRRMGSHAPLLQLMKDSMQEDFGKTSRGDLESRLVEIAIPAPGHDRYYSFGSSNHKLSVKRCIRLYEDETCKSLVKDASLEGALHRSGVRVGDDVYYRNCEYKRHTGFFGVVKRMHDRSQKYGVLVQLPEGSRIAEELAIGRRYLPNQSHVGKESYVSLDLGKRNFTDYGRQGLHHSPR